MAWIEIHDDIWEHWKTLRLTETLKIEITQAVGHLISMWHFALRNCPMDGNLEPWGDLGIAKAARWEDDPIVFVKALREHAWLDGSVIHNWDKYTLHYFMSLEKRERGREQARERMKRFRKRNSSAGYADATPSYAATVPNLTKPNQTVVQPGADNGSQDRKDDTDAGFNEFWKAYPKREAKAPALKAWRKLKPDQELRTRIMAAVAVRSKTEAWLKENGKFVPLPATWLNAKRWEDELPGVKANDVDEAQSRAYLEHVKKIQAGLA